MSKQAVHLRLVLNFIMLTMQDIIVDYLINRIKVLTNKYRSQIFWKNIKIFLDEQKNSNIPVSVKCRIGLGKIQNYN